MTEEGKGKEGRREFERWCFQLARIGLTHSVDDDGDVDLGEDGGGPLLGDEVKGDGEGGCKEGEAEVSEG